MRILVVSNMYPDKAHPSYGIFVKRFVDELDALKIEHKEVVISKHENKLVKAFAYIKFYISSFFKALSNKYDVIYVHYISHSSPGVLMASKFKKLNIIANTHGDDIVPRTNTQKKMLKYSQRLINKASIVVAPSKHFADVISKNFEIDEEKLRIYPSAGVDERLFYPDDNNPREEVIPTIGFVGRIDEGKGWDTFINAAKLVLDDGIKCRFMIVGSGMEEDKLSALIAKHELQRKVLHLKMFPQDSLPVIYRSMDYFAFTSKLNESLGLTVIEAMSCGVVPIVSDIEVTKEYVDDTIGYRFEKDNVKDLYEVMRKAIKDYDNREDYFKKRTNVVTMASNYHRSNIRSVLKEIIYHE